MQQYIELGQRVIDAFNNIPPQWYGVVLGGGLSVFTTGVIKKIVKVYRDVEKSKWFGILFLVVSAFYTLIDYLATNNDLHSHLSSYGKGFVVLVGSATTIYHALVLPTRRIYQKIQDNKAVVTIKAAEIQDALAAQDATVAPTVPAAVKAPVADF